MTNFQTPVTPTPGNPPAKLTAVLPDRPAKPPEQANLDSQSVAGEEDPGAALDMPAGLAGLPASQSVPRPPDAINPGDEAAEGTPGTGDNICRECGGSGRAANGPCQSCAGSGKVTAALGGA